MRADTHLNQSCLPLLHPPPTRPAGSVWHVLSLDSTICNRNQSSSPNHHVGRVSNCELTYLCKPVSSPHVRAGNPVGFGDALYGQPVCLPPCPRTPDRPYSRLSQHLEGPMAANVKDYWPDSKVGAQQRYLPRGNQFNLTSTLTLPPRIVRPKPLTAICKPSRLYPTGAYS